MRGLRLPASHGPAHGGAFGVRARWFSLLELRVVVRLRVLCGKVPPAPADCGSGGMNCGCNRCVADAAGARHGGENVLLDAVLDATGLTYRQLDYAITSGKFTPELGITEPGSGFSRRYTKSDLLRLTIYKNLCNFGITSEKAFELIKMKGG